MPTPSVGDTEDIVIRIVGFLHDIHPAGDWPDPSDEEQISNRQTLVSCALVNRTWYDAAQKLLYHTVFASYQEEYCKEIATILEDHRHLLVHVSVLQLSSDWLANWWPIGWTAFSQMPNLVDLELRFDFWAERERYEELWQSLKCSNGLRNVKKLTVHGYPVPSIAVFCSHLCLFRQIQDLKISSCTMDDGLGSIAAITTSEAGSLRTRPSLLSFQWMCEYGALTQDMDPMAVLAWFDTSSLEILILETTPTNWTPILSLCLQAQHTLRHLQIKYMDAGNGEKDAIPNSTLPNLLLFASRLPSTSTTFTLQVPSFDIIAWMQQTLIEVETSNETLDLTNVKLCIEAHKDPPADLKPFIGALQSLRKHVKVDFTFSADNDTEERLFAVAPMLPDLLAEEVVTLTMTYSS